MPIRHDDDSIQVKKSKGAQAADKSPLEGVLRDSLYDSLRAHVRKRGITVAQVYPRIRHLEFKRLAGGKEGQPEAFSLSKLILFADALNAQAVAKRALCEAVA